MQHRRANVRIRELQRARLARRGIDRQIADAEAVLEDGKGGGIRRKSGHTFHHSIPRTIHARGWLTSARDVSVDCCTSYTNRVVQGGRGTPSRSLSADEPDLCTACGCTGGLSITLANGSELRGRRITLRGSRLTNSPQMRAGADWRTKSRNDGSYAHFEEVWPAPAPYRASCVVDRR
jgi:hypothetical protein